LNTVPERYRQTDGQLTVASPRSALASRVKIESTSNENDNVTKTGGDFVSWNKL